MWTAVFIVWCVIATAVASWIGYKVKGRPLTGFFCGILLGWIGVLIIALVPATAEKKIEKQMSDRAIHEEAMRRYASRIPPGPQNVVQHEAYMDWYKQQPPGQYPGGQSWPPSPFEQTQQFPAPLVQEQPTDPQ